MQECHEKIFSADIQQVPELKNYIEAYLDRWHIDDRDKQDIVLATDEAATNIILHGYENKKVANPQIRLIIKNNGKQVKVTLEDSGRSFDPEKVPPPDITKNLAGQRKGGFGLFLMKTLMDQIRFRCIKGKNFTFMIKKIS